jgi:hypothetical protein
MDGGGGVSFLINDTAVLDLYADRMETINLACAQSRTGPLDDKVRPCILCKLTRFIVLFLFMSEVPQFYCSCAYNCCPFFPR